MKIVLLLLVFPLLLSAQNFHEVEKGVFYRSAQLSKSGFKKYIEKYGIKTVINLRGANPGKKWYDQEIEAIKESKNVLHYNIRMSAGRLPHREDLVQLLELYRNVSRPILIHCQAGVDRTGEASAIYTQEYMGWSKKKSLKMLSPQYGHFKIFKPAKTYFIDKVYKGENWALQEYFPCEQNYKYYSKEKFCENDTQNIEELELLFVNNLK